MAPGYYSGGTIQGDDAVQEPLPPWVQVTEGIWEDRPPGPVWPTFPPWGSPDTPPPRPPARKRRWKKSALGRWWIEDPDWPEPHLTETEFLIMTRNGLPAPPPIPPTPPAPTPPGTMIGPYTDEDRRRGEAIKRWRDFIAAWEESAKAMWYGLNRLRVKPGPPKAPPSPPGISTPK
jgi:hypothetical protein